MDFNQIILYIMAFGAALGGVDCALGNKLGFGDKFENGFQMLGPVALSMAGIICLAPLLSFGLGMAVHPICALLHLDPGIFGSLLAIDMGGYTLALDLAENPEIGRFSGIIASAIFGCTIVFTVPVGIGFLQGRQQLLFIRGILLGLTAMPVSLILGGIMMGLTVSAVLWNCLPILLLSVLLAAGMLFAPNAMTKGFLRFAQIIRGIAILGLTVAAIQHLAGISLFPAMPPLQEAMETVSSICIVMLGSMPLAELIQRALKVPFGKISEKTGLDSISTTALLLGLVSATPALALVPEMNDRGKVVISACLVSAISVFGAHFAFAVSCEPQLVPALLSAKLLGGLLGGVIAMFATRDLAEVAV